MEELSGRGLASALIGSALDDVVASGGVIVGVCPFVAAYVGRHPEYSASVQQPGPEDLAKV